MQRAYGSVLKTYGKDYTPDLKMKIMGQIGKEGVNIIIKELNLKESPEILSKKLHDAMYKVLDQAQLLPGTFFIYL